MKKLVAISAVTGVYAMLHAKKAYAWFGSTHKDILAKALTLLYKTDRNKFYDFYARYTSILEKGAVAPDKKGDIDKGSGVHYYCAADKKGKALSDKNGYYKNRLGKFSKSARTLLEENYTCALSLYKSSRTEQAMYYLGRAAHFIQDIGCVVHSSGIRYMDRPKNPHCAFESYAQNKCKAIDSPKSLDRRVLKAYENNLGAAANRLSKFSSGYASDVLTLDEKTYDRICLATIPPAQQYTAGLLIRFYEDANKNNGNFLLDGKRYTIKNELTGGYLTYNGRSVFLDSAGNNKGQHFYAVLNDDGSFSIKCCDGSFISKNFKCALRQKKDCSPAVFRFSALGNRRYRISAGACNYKKVVCTDTSGKIKLRRFSPDDMGSIWLVS